jgi:hypothetical protein
MRGLRLPRSRSAHGSSRPYRSVVPLIAALALLAAPAGASAANGTTEEVASARWTVPFQCADGTTADGRLLVESTRFFEAPAKEDPTPTVRTAFVVVCSGSTFSWGAGASPVTIESTPDLKSVSVTGTFNVRDNSGVSHVVSVDVDWTGVGPIETTVNSPGSMRRQRAATATGTVTFDGGVVVDGEANNPSPPPFIRVDTEK